MSFVSPQPPRSAPFITSTSHEFVEPQDRSIRQPCETRKLRTILLECGLDEDFKHAAIELVKLVDAPTGLVNSGLRVGVDAESKSVLLSDNKDQVREGLALLARLDIPDAEKARAKKLKQAKK